MTRGRVAARLFDVDRPDERPELDVALGLRLRPTQLLWIDLSGPADPAALEAIGKRLGLAEATLDMLRDGGPDAELMVHGEYLHLRLEAFDDRSDRPVAMDLVAADNVVVTAHATRSAFLERLDARIERDATMGRQDAVTFMRGLVDGVVTTYFEAVDAIELAIDALDDRSLRAHPDDDILAELVRLRHRISRTRRILVSQREVFTALTTIDVSKIAPEAADGPGMTAVIARYESAIRSVEESRDLVLGSFDVYMTRLAQRTNDVMKVLAIATVLLLPGSLIAGLLGMNVSVPLSKDDPLSFWLVIALVAIMAAAFVFVLARAGWIGLPSSRTIAEDATDDDQVRLDDPDRGRSPRNARRPRPRAAHRRRASTAPGSDPSRPSDTATPSPAIPPR